MRPRRAPSPRWFARALRFHGCPPQRLLREEAAGTRGEVLGRCRHMHWEPSLAARAAGRLPVFLCCCVPNEVCPRALPVGVLTRCARVAASFGAGPPARATSRARLPIPSRSHPPPSSAACLGVPPGRGQVRLLSDARHRDRRRGAHAVRHGADRAHQVGLALCDLARGKGEGGVSEQEHARRARGHRIKRRGEERKRSFL